MATIRGVEIGSGKNYDTTGMSTNDIKKTDRKIAETYKPGWYGSPSIAETLNPATIDYTNNPVDDGSDDDDNHA